MSVFLVNGLLALGAVFAHLYAVRLGDPALRGIRSAIAALAAFYAAGYFWVVLGGDPIAWSQFFRKVSLVAWIIVWWLPPIIGARANQRHRREVERLREG